MQTRDVWEYLLKQGYELTKADWETLNVEGSLKISNFNLTHVNYINKHSKLVATQGSIRCGS